MDDVHVSSSGSANVVATTSTNCHMVCTCANTNHMRHETLYSKIFLARNMFVSYKTVYN